MIALMLSLCLRVANRVQLKLKKLTISIPWITGLVLASVIFLFRELYAKESNIALIRINRQLIVVIAGLLTLSFLLELIHLISRKGLATGVLPKAIYSLMQLAAAALITYSLPQIFQYTTEFVYFGEGAYGTTSLMRTLGFVLGLVLAFIVFYAFYKISGYVGDKALKITLLVFLGLCGLDYIVKAVMALQRMRIIPLTDIVFEIMIWGDKNKKTFIYAVFVVAVALSLYVIVKTYKPLGEFANNALRRKKIAFNRRQRRWSNTVILVSLLSVFVLTVVHYYDTKEVELAPPSPYKIEENIIMIDIAQLEDGHLHRYEYKTPNGYNVKFLAVKKPIGTSYGLGLDACEICGIAGYFERGNEVVCKRCDVVMNKSTIGFKGGCNPIPFPYVIQDGIICIKCEDLIREEKRFK